MTNAQVSCWPTAQVGDIGLALEVQFVDASGAPVNLAGATSIVFYLGPPDGTAMLNRTGSLSTNGSDGKVRYATTANDLTKLGLWRWQAKVSTPTFGPRSSRCFALDVQGNVT